MFSSSTAFSSSTKHESLSKAAKPPKQKTMIAPTVTDPFLFERLAQPSDRYEALQARNHKSVTLLHKMQIDEGYKSKNDSASGNSPVVSRMD